MRALLDALGRPDSHGRFVVVAGTNGKGSTSALLADALQYSGQRVGLYTSPHLLRFSERVRINQQEIEPADIVAYYKQICRVQHLCPRLPSFFECATAIALLAFAEARVDIAVLEVGLGGRLDATNVVPRILSVITPIALDHQEYLGETLTAIAAEKADIIAHNTPVVVSPQSVEALHVIKEVAYEREASMTFVSSAAGIPAHQPPYQKINIATARAAARILACPEAAIERAVQEFAWSGRYQWFMTDGSYVVLDGAHNPAGVGALLDALAGDARCRGKALHGIFSALQSKPARQMLDLMRQGGMTLRLCPTQSRRSMNVAQLKALAPDLPVHETVAAALAEGRAASAAGDILIVTGSLFLVADALVALRPDLRRDPPVDG